MARPITRTRLYRVLALLAFFIALTLVLAVPLKMQEPGDWNFLYAARNIAAGRITLTDSQYIQQSQEVWQAGGQLLGYGKLPDNRWALTFAPGYVLYISPFEAMGAPQLGAAILSLGLTAVLYLLLARLKDEKTALFGVVLLLFTPLYLGTWQRVYSDALAATALCGMGGGLYLFYWVSRDRLGPRLSSLVLFSAGLLLGASVAVRYTNVTIAAVFALHFLVMALSSHIRRERFLPVGLTFLLGAALPLGALLSYHAAVYGSPLSYGYQFTQLPVNFAWGYPGGDMAYNIIRNNVIQLWAPLLLGMPLLLIALPAFAAAGYGKLLPSLRQNTWHELPAHAWWALTGWVTAVFGLYVMYEWTSTQQSALLPFTLLTRFYLPALFPLAVMSALALSRLPSRIWGSVLVAASVVGAIFYIQAVNKTVQFTVGITPPTLSLPAPADTADRLSMQVIFVKDSA